MIATKSTPAPDAAATMPAGTVPVREALAEMQRAVRAGEMEEVS
jgi:hypothetical protein